MPVYSDKVQDKKSQSIANTISNDQNQAKPSFQFKDNRPEAVTQRKLKEMADDYSSQQQQPPEVPEQAIQKKENNTGLPDNLKSGIEKLSGLSMDDVKVHYNSDKPAQLQAHAFAQGTDIHLGQGQEKHLPHEAWHVVQQKQGRVKPTMQMKGGVNVNDDKGLEKEADVMGQKAIFFNQMNSTNDQLNPAISSNLIQKVRYESSSRGRMLRPPFDDAISEICFFDLPSYTSSGIRGAGGAHSTAVLGPAGTYLNSKSDAQSNLPSYIESARLKYPASSLKAGHLLNAQFGGHGNDANNLTILSASGNSNHKSFDEPVKKAINSLKAAYYILWEDGINISSVKIGISIEVKVNTENTWPNETQIFGGLTCKASVVNYSGDISGDFDQAKGKSALEAFTGQMKLVGDYCAEATTNGKINNNP